MLDLFAAISSADPPSLVAWLVLAFAAGMYPLGLMLGAPCSPCCPQNPQPVACLLQDSTGSPVLTPAMYACDNGPSVTTGTFGRGSLYYFDPARVRTDGGVSYSVAAANSCETLCTSNSVFVPQYYFAARVPNITFSVSFLGQPERYIAYDATTTLGFVEKNCFYTTTAAKYSGSYVLSHTGNGIFSYTAPTGTGGDIFQVVASMHRCNSVPMWFITIQFTARGTKSQCSTAVCDAQAVAVTSKTLRCCRPHCLDIFMMCKRTNATFAEHIPCDQPLPAGLSLDVESYALLSTSGAVQYVGGGLTTSGTDNTFGNPFGTPGVRMNITNPNLPNSSAAAPCFCSYPTNDFFTKYGEATALSRTGTFTLTAS